MSNLKKDIEKLKICHYCSGVGYCEHKKEITQQLINLIESVVDDLKPDTNLLGCDKHWTDNYGGTCTCDENERIAIRFYKKAISDIKSKLIDGEGDE